MKKPALLILSLSALLTLASCGLGQQGGSSSEESVTTSSEEVIGKSTVKAVYNSTYGSKLSIGTGDSVDSKGTITFVDSDSKGENNYQILVNKTIADMKMASDGITYTYDYKVDNGADMVVAIVKKTATDDNGHKVTFEQGEHYTIVGITSGGKYSVSDVSGVNFAVVPDVGYVVEETSYKGEGKAPVYLSESNGTYSIYSSYSATFNCDLVLSVKVKKGSTHKITYNYDVEAYEAHMDASSSYMPTSFVGGEQIAFSFKTLSGYGMTNVNVKYVDEDAYMGYSFVSPFDESFTHYTVQMPDEDIIVDLSNGDAITLSYESNDKVSNVGFYANRDFVDDGTTVVDPITEYTIGKGSVYVAFNVADGYAPTGLSLAPANGDSSDVSSAALFAAYEGDGDDDFDWGDDDDDFDWGDDDDGGYDYYDDYSVCENTVDGRCVIEFSLDYEAKLIFDLGETSKVDLDSSCDKLDIEFDGGSNGFLPGDRVDFTAKVKDEYASSWLIKSLTLCYGEDEDEIYGYDGSYSFTMPYEKATIKAELYQPKRVSVSYTNNAGGLVSSVTLEGDDSGASFGEGTSSSSFIAGESASLTIETGSDHSKKVKAYLVTSEGKEEISLSFASYDGAYNGYIEIPDGGASIEIEAGDSVDSVPLTLPEGVSFSFYTSEDASSKASNFAVYPYDVFYFTIDSSEEGKVAVPTVTATYYDEYLEEDDEMTVNLSTTTIDGKTAYKADLGYVSDVKGVNIDVEFNGTYSFTAKTVDGDDATSFMVDDNNQPLDFTAENKVLEGTKFSLGYPYNNFYKVDKVTINGVEDEGESDWNGSYWYVTGDVVVTVSLKD